MKTPQLSYPELSAALGIATEVWLKREDKHYYGSHKGRSIPLMVAGYAKQGIANFVISSSGNAALAAARTVETHNKSKDKTPLSLTVCVGNKIGEDKLARLETAIRDARITIQQGKNPKQQAFQIDKSGAAKWLRQSTDTLALNGYHELAGELARIPGLAAVFVPTSSGTTAQGLYEGFKQLNLNPQIHIIQTEECHPMVIDQKQLLTPGNSERSLASAIVDKVAFRKPKVLEAIKNSGGAGWIALNTEIVQAQKLVKEITGIELSPNSALSVAGLTRAINAGWKWRGPVVSLITGR